MSVHAWLNRTLQVYRPQVVGDGIGGQTTTLVLAGLVKARVSQPSALERQVAEQAQAHHTHVIHLPPRADVGRGDELRGGGQAFRVLDTIAPSRAIYLRADAELLEAEG